MKKREASKQIPGVTLEEEKETLSEILTIADENLKRARSSVENLAEELHELKEVYDLEDKEGLALWFNTDARFQQVRQELFRMERSRKKPYFGRIDFTDLTLSRQECYYIGKTAITTGAAEPVVIDWRAPIASVYYESTLGKCTYTVEEEDSFEIDLSRKRTYEIDQDELKDFYDTDVVANDELLTKYLARNKRAVLNDIIATIQQEQNEIIRRKPQYNVIVQGGAGSGKTTVAMHRISYILYNYDREFQPKDFYIIGSNQILLNYITGVLPDLDVYGISQMTMEQLFIRLLYEDWDDRAFTVKKLDRENQEGCVKGRFAWYHDLEEFCRRYEWSTIPREDVYTEKTRRLLMTREKIEELLTQFDVLSRADKLDKLTEHLIAKLENEVYGKYDTYPLEEQKKLFKYYQTYFGKRDWKGSIFDLYDKFLREQNEKGSHIPLPGGAFDLYDLAALAYLYKRIKETEVIQEASHVVIDEAQDFGMMAYGALHYCMSKCTFTIMGDVSQNIYFNYGLTDWEELRGLMLTKELDYFGLLRKSYRNTVEISNFATNILQHGNFPIYPVEPIIRHGNEVRTAGWRDEKQMLERAADTVLQWQKQGYETIAVICREESDVPRIWEMFQTRLELRDFRADAQEFGSGVMILPIEYAKGLEFDAVLLLGVDNQNYPAKDGFAKLLYVAATRALHELAAYYTGRLTDLIATTVSEEKKQRYLVAESQKSSRIRYEKQKKSKQEREQERVSQGRFELEFRDKIGPKKIAVPNSGIRPGAQQEPVPSSGTATASRLGTAEFGTMPSTNGLKLLGHSNVSMSIRWINRNGNSLDLTSSSGILRITPISGQTVRISFARDSFDVLADIPEELVTAEKSAWKFREVKNTVEILLKNLILRIDKKTGVITFYTEKGEFLLSEASPLPRQIAVTPKLQTWIYFNWTKKEILKARGTFDKQLLDLKSTVRYISCGAASQRPACLISNLGYQILVPAGKRVMCCTIPVYGSYLHTEGDSHVDYFFRISHHL